MSKNHKYRMITSKGIEIEAIGEKQMKYITRLLDNIDLFFKPYPTAKPPKISFLNDITTQRKKVDH